MMREHIPAYVAPLVLYSSRWTWFKQFVWSFNIFVHYRKKKQPRSNKFYIPISRVVAFHQYDFAYIQQASSWTSSSPNIGILRTFTFEAFYDIFMIYIGHHWNSTTRHGCEEIFKFSYFWLHITFISK